MSGQGRRDLCVMACAFCRHPDFLVYLQEIDSKHQEWTEGGAKEFVLTICQISSRSQLDRDQHAARRFHELVRQPFLDWKARLGRTDLEVASSCQDDGEMQHE